MKFILLLFLFLNFMHPVAHKVPYRHYTEGTITRYRLTSKHTQNGLLKSVSIAVVESRVILDQGQPVEEIRWLGKILMTGNDTIVFDSIARTVPPYRISLTENGTVLLPAYNQVEMADEMADLNTIWLSVSPALQAQKLTVKKPALVNPEIRSENFANGQDIRYGTGCMEVSQTLLEMEEAFSKIQTDYAPPASLCLEPLADTVAVPNTGKYNNFQMIRAGADSDKVNLFWGTETLSVRTKLNNTNGQIMAATMINELNLRMRFNSETDLTAYQKELPVKIEREVRLDFISETLKHNP